MTEHIDETLRRLERNVGEYQWVETRMRAIELFSDAPSAVQEQRVLDVFREHPALVVEGVEHVGRRFADGQVRNPWAVLAKHVEEAVRPLEDFTATDERDRDKAIRRAEQWMRAAGKHFDRWEEVEDELFGELGRIPQYASDEVCERMARLWNEVNGEGELIAEQAEERARRWREGPKTRDPEPVLAALDEEPALA